MKRDMPVRWGVLGWSGIARLAFVPTLLASPSGKLIAVASERTDAQAIENELPDVGIHTGPKAYDTLFSRGDIDAVYVSVANHLHAPLTHAACEAEIDVLCEKPLAVGAHEAERMSAHAADTGVILAEALMTHFNPQHSHVRQLIAADKIGRPRLFRAALTVCLSDPARDIRFLPRPGSGALWDTGIYPIAVARSIFGREPVSAEALAVNRAGTQVDELTAIILRFGDDQLAAIDCGLTLAPRNTYEVVGERGTIAVSRPFGSPPYLPAEPKLDVLITTKDGCSLDSFPDVNQYALQLDAFHRLVTGDPTSGSRPYPLQESILNARVIDACRSAFA